MKTVKTNPSKAALAGSTRSSAKVTSGGWPIQGASGVGFWRAREDHVCSASRTKLAIQFALVLLLWPALALQAVTTVTSTTTYPSGLPPYTYTFDVTVRDCEPPGVSCRPVQGASGKIGPNRHQDSVPKRSGSGFYQLLGHDNCDPNPRLFIEDSASGYVAGPFAAGDIVQITKEGRHKTLDNVDGSNGLRSRVVVHIHLRGEGLLFGVDASGNVGQPVYCPGPY